MSTTLDTRPTAQPPHKDGEQAGTAAEAREPPAQSQPGETALRQQILVLLAAVSHQENWTLRRCAAVARNVANLPTSDLDAVAGYFSARHAGRFPHSVDGLAETEDCPWRACSSAPVQTLYAKLEALERQLAPTPAYVSGIQGVRIMRLVALMSK